MVATGSLIENAERIEARSHPERFPTQFFEKKGTLLLSASTASFLR
jgi:hypothetical protein